MGCARSNEGRNAQQQGLKDARERWEQHRFHRYSVVQETGCAICPLPDEPVQVVVRNDTIASLTGVVSGMSYDDAYFRSPPAERRIWREAYLSVPALFDLVAQALQEDFVRLYVRYDPQYGYPEIVRYERGDMSDDEGIHVLTNLRPE
jgi:hypothetical protein